MKLISNQSIRLDDPNSCWLVQSGEIALFSITLKDHISIVSRHYLFSCNSSESIFPILSETINPHRQIMAVAMVDTEIAKISSLEWEKLLFSAQPEAINFVKNWAEKLESLSSNSEIKLDYLDISVIHSWDDLQKNLSKLHTDIWEIIIGLEKQRETSTSLHLQARDLFNRQTTVKALEGLGSLLPQSKVNVDFPLETITDYSTLLSPENSTNDPIYISLKIQSLYIAACAVGKAMGITILPPAASENLQRLKEPIEAIARASNIRIRRVILTDYWWEKDCGSLLAYTQEENLPVALLQVAPTRYQLFDPVTTTHTPVNAEIAQVLNPVAFTFYQPLPENLRSPRGFIPLLQFSLKNRNKDLFILLWSGIGSTILGMFTPQAIAILIDEAIPDSNPGLLVQIGLALFASGLGRLCFQLIQAFAIIRIETLADISTQAAVWDRLLNLPVLFFRQYSTGDLRARVSAISEIRRQLGGTTLQTLFTSVVTLPNLFLLFYYSWQLALVAIIIILINLAVTTFIGLINLRKSRRLQEIQGNIFGLMVQLINSLAKLRISGAEKRAFAHWSQQYAQQQKLTINIQKWTDNLVLFNQLLPTLSLVILFIIVGNLISHSNQNYGLSTGIFLAFNAAFGVLLASTTAMGDVIIKLLSIVVLWERAKPILEAQPEVNTSQSDPGKLSGKLALEHIQFSYNQNTSLILDDVTINAQPGEFIAFVGPSGSGKSTIIRLLLGFETPQSGNVYYDGKNLRDLNIQSVRRQLGVVLQTSRINTGSILNNIAGSAIITIDEAWEAARQAGLADDIAAMPMEMHTVISEGGSNISGGQKQRLLIARALVLKPKILLLDEATSALDNITQAMITKSLSNLQVTRIVIAHRLSTIKNADRIYVLEKGKIVQSGSFEQLINQEGLFIKLMASQMT